MGSAMCVVHVNRVRLMFDIRAAVEIEDIPTSVVIKLGSYCH